MREATRPRPLLWPAVAFMAGIWLSETYGDVADPGHWRTLLLAATGLATLLVGLLAIGGRPHVTAALVLVLACGVGFVRHQAAIRRPAHHIANLLKPEPILTRLAGEVITAPVTQPPQRRNPFVAYDPPARTSFVLAARELRTTDSPTPVCGRIRVNIEAGQLGLRLGETIELTGQLYRPRPPQNPGEFDWARWHYLQGLDAGMNVEGAAHLRRSPQAPPLVARVLSAIRGGAQSLLIEPFGEVGSEAGARLLDTMVLGHRASADRRLNEAFLRAGGLHFLAVSGFHVGVLAAATWWLTRRLLKRSRTTAAVVMLIVIVLYAVVAEPRAPILRAATLGVLAALAMLSRRPFSVLNALACAAIGVLAYNPLELFRPGFQLSFVQVIGLLTLVPWVYRTMVSRRSADDPPQEADTPAQFVVLWLWRAALGLLIVCVVAWALALPLVCYHFERFAPWGALGTLLLAVPVTAAIWLSFLTLAANLLAPPVGHLLAKALEWVTDGLLGIVGLFERVPHGVVEVTSPPAWLVAGTYAALLLVLATRRPNHRGRAPAEQPARRSRLTLGTRWAAVGGLMLAWAMWIYWPGPGPGPGCGIHILAVGDGSTTLLTTPDRRAAVFDVGTNRNADAGETAAAALRSLGIHHLAGVFISHANFDHYSGLPTLLQHVPADHVLVNPYLAGLRHEHAAVKDLFALLPPAVDIEPLAAGERLSWGPVQFEVLWPPAGLDPAAYPANDRSLVVRLHAGGRTALLTGDIETAAMRALLAADAAGRIRLPADVLIAPHHGSVIRPETSEFYAAVDPQVIVVSSAKPRRQVADLVRETLGPECRLLSTRDLGAICVRLMPNGEILIETPYATGGDPAPSGCP